MREIIYQNIILYHQKGCKSLTNHFWMACRRLNDKFVTKEGKVLEISIGEISIFRRTLREKF